MNIHSAVTTPGGKREAILDAALDLFVERGFHGTAVPAVADRAQVGAGTIYRYFDSKEALVNALYQRWKRALAAAVFDAFPVEAPPREQFHTLWARMTEFVAAHPRVYVFLELHHHASYLDEASRALENQLDHFAAGLVRSAQERGAIKSLEPGVLIAILLGAFVGILRASWEGRVALDEALSAAEQCCWDAIRR
jgi:AcrR family transcriptional regulator